MKRRLLNYLFSLLTLAVALCAPQTARADELTVNNGTATSTYVPIYGLMVDNFQHSQFVIHADSLTEMADGTISAMTFHLSTPATDTWGSAVFEVRLMEIDATSPGSSFMNVGDADLVFSGSLSATASEMSIEFSTDYVYNGGNLLVDIQETTKGSWKSATFAGVSGNGISGYNSSSISSVTATARNFSPKVTFTYEAGGVITCEKPASIAASDVTSNSANLAWTAGGSESSYELTVKPKGGAAVVTVETGLAKALTGLTPATEYSVALRAICAPGDTSKAVTAAFVTECEVVSTLPWIEDFDNYDAVNLALPCWSNTHIAGTATANVFKVVAAANGNTSTKQLQLPDMQAGNQTLLVLPEMSIPRADAYAFSFDIYRKSYSTLKPNEGIQVYAYYQDSLYNLGFAPRDIAVEGVNVPVETADNWYNYEFVLPFAGEYRIVLIGVSEYGSATNLDNFRVRAIPTCKKPKDVKLTYTNNSATLTWTGNAPRYALEIKQGAVVLFNDTVNTASYTVTGLTSATEYSFTGSIKGLCSDEDESEVWEGGFTFTTKCDPLTSFTYTEDFENVTTGSGKRPTVCWYAKGTYPYAGTTSSSAHGGSKYLYFYGMGSSNVYTTMPEFAPDLNEARLKFWYKQTSTTASYGQLEVGTMSDPTDFSTYVAQEALARTSTYTQADISLGNVPADHHFIAFRLVGGTSGTYFYVDDIEVTNQPACKNPGAVTVTPTTKSATIAWAGNAARYALLVKNGSTVIFNDTVNTASYTVPALTAATDYTIDVTIKGICGENETSEEVTKSLSFTTECEPISSLPWTEGFESYATGSGKLPVCWAYYKSGETYPYVYTTTSTGYIYSGSKCLYFYGGSTNVREVILPEITADLSDARVRFWYRSSVNSSTTTYGNLIVGFINNGTFVPADTLPQSSTLVQYELEFSLPGNSNYLAVRYAGGTSSYGAAYVDEIVIDNAPACKKVKNIKVDATTANSATISWTPGSDETAWIVDYVAYGATDTVKNVAVSGQPQFTFTNLAHSTYYAYVVTIVSDCGSEQSESVQEFVEFGTECSAALANYVNDTLLFDFNNDNYFFYNPYTAPCWLNWDPADAESEDLWYLVNGYSKSGYAMAVSDADGALISLATPLIDVPDNYQVGFFARAYDDTEADTIFVYYNTVQSLEGATLLGTTGTLPGDYANSPFTFALPADHGEYYIILVAHADEGYSDIMIDDLMFTPKPNCQPVKALTLGEVTGDSFTFSWQHGGEEESWLVEIDGGEDSEIYENWFETTDTVFTYEGLESATAYADIKVSVKAVCGDELESEAVTEYFSFTTLCNPVASLPWSEGFEDYEGKGYSATNGVMPVCWDVYTTSTVEPHVGLAGSYVYAHEGTKCLTFYGKGYNYAVLPEFAHPINDMQISFWRQMENVSYGTLTLGYIKAGDVDMHTFTAIENISNVSTMTKYEKVLDEVPDDAKRLVLRWYYTGQYDCSVDDITITALPPCKKPKSLKVTADAESATFQWVGTADTYLLNIIYGEEKWADSVIVENADTFFVVSNLSPATQYANIEVSIVGMCGTTDTTAVYSTTTTFVTACTVIDELPYSSGFEVFEDETSLPLCWSALQTAEKGNRTYPGVVTTNVYKGSHALAFYGGNDTTVNVIALPEITASLAGKRLTFWRKDAKVNATLANLIVGYLTDADDASTFVALDTLPQTAAYKRYQVALDGVPASVHFLAFRYAGGSIASYVYVDELAVNDMPSCQGAEDLALVPGSITINSAAFTWTSDVQNAKVVYTLNGGEEQTALAEGNTFTLSGLKPATVYSVNLAVLPVCDNESEAIDTIAVTTAVTTECDTVSTFPWAEDFEAYSAGNFAALCWSNVHTAGNKTDVFKVYGSANGTNSTKQLQLPDMNDGNITRLTLPLMDIPEADAYQFRFDIYRTHTMLAKTTEGIRVFAQYADTLVEFAFVPRVDTVSNAVIPAVEGPLWCTYEFTLPFAGLCNIILQGESRFGNPTYMDNFVVRELPSCFGATDFAVVDSAATTTSLTFTWESEAPSFKIHYVSGDSTINANATSSLPSFTINNLKPSSTYSFNFEVVSVCEGGEAIDTLKASVTASTVCAAISELPWSENFENTVSGSGKLPVCWNYTSTNVTNPYVYNATTSYEGDKCMYFYGGGSSPREVVLPEFSADLSNARIRFWYKNSSVSTSYGNIILGYLDGDTAFVAIDTLAQTATYVRYEKYLVVNGSHYLVFRYAGGTSTYGSAYIDDIIVDEIPTCLPAKNLRVVAESITKTSAAFAWSPVNGEEAWRVVVKNGSEVVADSVVTDSVYSFTGLTAATVYNYDVEVYAKCSDTDIAEPLKGKLTFATECDAVSTFPWSETFESYEAANFADPCWINEHIAGTSTTSVFKVVAAANGNTSTKQLQLPDMSVGNQTMLALPVMNVPAADSYAFSFNIYRTTTYTGKLNEGIQVYAYYQDSLYNLGFAPRVATLEGVNVPAEEAAGWFTYQFTMPFAGEYRIVLIGVSEYGAATNLDNFAVTALPDCHKPAGLAADSVTTNSAVLTWKGNSAAYELKIMQGDNELFNDTVYAANYTLTGLTPATSYTLGVTVKGLCGEEGNSEVLNQNIDFDTECEAVTTFPWSENFDAEATANFKKVCWSNTHVAGTATANVFKVVAAANGNTSTKQLQLPDMQAGNQTLLVLPEMSIPRADAYAFSFDIYRKSYSTLKPNEGIQVYAYYQDSLYNLGFAPRDIAVEGVNVPVETGDNWYNYEFTLPFAGACNIALLGVSEYGSATNLDNFEVKALPACRKPVDLEVVTSARQAVFSWTGNAPQYEVGVTTSTGDTLFYGNVNAATVSVDTLKPETYYNLTLAVKGLCGEEDGESAVAVKSFTFTTPASCLTVKNLQKFSVTENEAVFTWESNGEEDAWRVRAINMSAAPYDTVFSAADSRVYSINTLQPNTDYTFRIEVYAYCGEGDSSRVVAQNFTFTTPMPADYTEELVLNVPFAADFDEASERQKWGFIGNTEPNHFIFGTDTAALVGEAMTGLYVTNNNADYAYSINLTSSAAVYRKFSVATDSLAEIRVDFTWLANGEVESGTAYDFGRAIVVPDDKEIAVTGHVLSIAGTSMSMATAAPANCVSLPDATASNALCQKTEFEVAANEHITLPEGTYKLLFIWRNDGGSGQQYPLAVGDVNVTLTNVINKTNSAVGLGNINADTDSAQKFIHNGHVFILYRGVIYDATGRRVEMK